MGSVNSTIINWGNGLLPVWPQAIALTSGDLLSVGPLETNKFLIRIQNLFENVVCKTSAILCQPQWVNDGRSNQICTLTNILFFLKIKKNKTWCRMTTFGIFIISWYLFKCYFKFHYHSNQNLLKYFDAYTQFFCPRSLRWDSYNHLHFWLYDLLYILPSNHCLMKSINISLNFCHKIKYWTQAAVMELYRVLVVGTENDSIAGDFRLHRAWLLTHWLLGNFNEFFRTCNFQTDFSDWWLRYLLWNCT